MKLRGEFIVRRLGEDIVAIPMGQTALEFNGMVLLNEVSKIIWECLEQSCQPEEIVTAVTNDFDVSADEAKADIMEYLSKLRECGLLEE